jgi:TRAP-type C4-dicarboxylate transport system substrate-binding protein
MKNKLFLVLVACVLVVSLLLAACAPAPAPAPKPTPAPAPAPKVEPITLAYGSHNPPMGWEAQNASEPWIKQVSQATNGAVTIKGFYGEALIKGTAAWEAIKAGQADIAWIATGFFPGVFSLFDVMMLPFLQLPSSEAGADVIWQLYEKYPSMQKQWADVKVLTFTVLYPFFPATNNKLIKTPEDLKGMKLRALGGPQTDTLKLFEASPVMLGIGDCYENIGKGVVDGMLSNWEANMSFKIPEVAKNMSYLPFGSSFFATVMNLKKWNSLPPAVQQQIMSVSGRTGTKFVSKAMGDGSFAVGRKTFMDKGVTLNEFTPTAAEIETWKKAAEPVWEKWVKDQEAKGITDARAILNDMVQMLKNYK